MKIAYFLDRANGLGGAGNLLLQQAKLMAEKYEVIVVVPSDSLGIGNREYIERCTAAGLPYCTLEYTTAYNFRDIDFIGNLHSSIKIENLVYKEDISFFHSVQLNIAVEYVARKLHIPHIMDIYQLKEEEFSCCQGDIYSHYHLCDSNLYKERWSRKLGIESRCVRPIALLDNIKRKANYLKGPIRILMLGGVCERKNQLAAIKACEICMKQYRIILTIAGEQIGAYAEQCVQYVKENGLEENVIFAGFVGNIVPLLEVNDCLLCTSLDESFPSSMVEALSYDLSIISTPVAGVPEVFRNGKNAFVSETFSVDSISLSIKECIKRYIDGSIVEIKKCAYETWKENFSRDKVREQIDMFYKYVAEQPNILSGDFEKLLEKVIDVKRHMAVVYDECEELYKKALYHVKIQTELPEGKIYLWGAGKMGRYAYKILRMLCPELEMIAFVDKKKAGQYCGIPIIRPEELPINRNYYYGVCFLEGAEYVINYLEERGLVLNKQIWILP